MPKIAISKTGEVNNSRKHREGKPAKHMAEQKLSEKFKDPRLSSTLHEHVENSPRIEPNPNHPKRDDNDGDRRSDYQTICKIDPFNQKIIRIFNFIDMMQKTIVRVPHLTRPMCTSPFKLRKYSKKN